MSDLCSICCDKKVKITCFKCNFISCIDCNKTYFMCDDNAVEKEHCMSCRVIWTRSFLTTYFSKKFINDTLKKHREDILLKYEKSLLQNTQEELNNMKEKQKMKEELIVLTELYRYTKELSKYVNAYLRKFYKNHDPTLTYDVDFERFNNMSIELTKHNQELGDREFYLHERVKGNYTQTEERRQFIKHCPRNDCRGFLSNHWKCGICEYYICNLCHEEIGLSKKDEHQCKPENVQMAVIINKSCKSCPKCGVLIFKIDGCDQMWCTKCQTAFSWNTLQIQNGQVHNPHYYEYLASIGMNRDNIRRNDRCADNITSFDIMKFLTSKKIKYNDDLKNIDRAIIHNANVVIHRYNVNNTNKELQNKDLRFKYLNYEIDDAKFKWLLQKREKNIKKKNDIYTVYNSYNETLQTLFNNIITSETQKEYNDHISNIKSWRIWSNTEIEKINKIYDCRLPLILTTFIIADSLVQYENENKDISVILKEKIKKELFKQLPKRAI